MKKKLNLFCILIFVVLAFDMFIVLDVMFTGAMRGYDTAGKPGGSPRGKSYDYATLSLLPTEVTDRTAKTVGPGSGGREYMAWPTQLMVPADSCRTALSEPLAVTGGVVSLVLGIVALTSFVCFVRNINRREIFTRKNTAYLRRIGWCTIGAGALMTLHYCYDQYIVQQVFRLDGYVVDYSSSIYSEYILFGLFSLVMAEAFAIGLKMREEQDLTI